MVEAIAPTISLAERQRAMRRPPDNLGAWEAYQQALWYWSKRTGESFAVVRDLLQKAAALDPAFGQPHAILAWLYLSQATHGLGPPLRDVLNLAHSEARSAVELDPDTAMGRAALAWTFDHQGQWEHALEEARIAASSNPNDPFAQMTWGRALTFTGRPAEGREPLTDALRLDPHGPTAPTVIQHLGLGCYFLRDYSGAVAWAGRAIREFPKFPRAYPVYAAALGQLCRTDEARTALDAALAVSEQYLETLTASRMPYFRPEDHEHLLEGLRKAGWRIAKRHDEGSSKSG
jgi:adenylate cyclase